MENTLFKVQNLSHQTIDGHINNINLEVKKNTIYSVVVKDSSEKRILIEALKKEKNASGDIFLLNKKLNRQELDSCGENKLPIAFLHKNPLTIDNASVIENINFPALPRFKCFPLVNWKKAKQKCKNTLLQLSLDIPIKKKTRNLSYEDKKFVYLAQVIMQSPTIIIMNEPIEGLSPKNATKMHEIIQKFKENGGTVLYITKRWEEALRVSDTISILTNGELKDVMHSDEAKKNPTKFIEKIEGYHFKVNENINEENESLLNTVFRAAEFLTSEYELKDVLLLLAKEACNLMNADSCTIQLIDEDSWTIIDRFDYKKKSIFATMKPRILKEIAKKNKIYYANENNIEFNDVFQENHNVRTYICIPALIRSQVIGVIEIYYENLYIYSEEDYQYLSALSQHAAIAIEDTRLMGRSALLQESHHRIKNNLQSIVSLISLQKSNYMKDEEKSIDEILDNVIQRIKSIAVIHNILSNDQFGKGIINLKDIISTITQMSLQNNDIQIHMNLDDIFIPYNKATSIALIVNELIMNSIKHAFAEVDNKKIWIENKKYNEYILIKVKDNGIGIDDFQQALQSGSLGLGIIKGIVTSEFNGYINNHNHNGCEFEITIPSNRIIISNYD